MHLLINKNSIFIASQSWKNTINFAPINTDSGQFQKLLRVLDIFEVIQTDKSIKPTDFISI